MKPFPNRTSAFQRIRLSHLTLAFPWSIRAAVNFEVTFFAQGYCSIALSAIRHDSGEEGLAAKWHGMVYVCDWSFMTALTGTRGSFQGCQACRKTASTLPVRRDERFEVGRPCAHVW